MLFSIFSIQVKLTHLRQNAYHQKNEPYQENPAIIYLHLAGYFHSLLFHHKFRVQLQYLQIVLFGYDFPKIFLKSNPVVSAIPADGPVLQKPAGE